MTIPELVRNEADVDTFSSRELFGPGTTLYPLDTQPTVDNPYGAGIFTTYTDAPAQFIDPSFSVYEPEQAVQSLLLRGAAGDVYARDTTGQPQKVTEVRASEAYLYKTNEAGDVSIFFRQFLADQDHESTALRPDHAGASHPRRKARSGKNESIAFLEATWDAASGSIRTHYKRGYDIVRAMDNYQSIRHRRADLARLNSKKLVSSEQLLFPHTDITLSEGEEVLLAATAD